MDAVEVKKDSDRSDVFVPVKVLIVTLNPVICNISEKQISGVSQQL